MYWLCCAILNILFSVFAFITNPIVILFADEHGNLPRWLRWWQTYDNCLDVGWMVTGNHVPKIFRYDFNKHYVYHLEDKTDGRLIPGYVDIIDPNFTVKERIQRYFCRLAWLIRNNAYGFSYEVLGVDFDPKYNIVQTDTGSGVNREWKSYVLDKPGIWSWFLTKPWCKTFYVRIYFGWKLKGLRGGQPQRAMIACHFTFLHQIGKN